MYAIFSRFTNRSRLSLGRRISRSVLLRLLYTFLVFSMACGPALATGADLFPSSTEAFDSVYALVDPLIAQLLAAVLSLIVALGLINAWRSR